MTGLGEAFVLLAALAGGLAAIAAREAVLAAPAVAHWLAETIDPLRRAGREGYAPSEAERRRLAALGTGALTLAVLIVVGPGPAVLVAPVGPAFAGWMLSARSARYRRAVDRGLPEIARAIADALTAGRSIRAAVGSASTSLAGPPAAEMARVRADIELGSSTAEALRALRQRLESSRVDAFTAALLSQQLGGGDLAGLLRRFAMAAADRDRVDADARSATAQARFTGMLVVAMPTGAALFAELAEPGFVGGLLGNPVAAGILVAAGVLQLVGFLAIKRLSAVGET